MGGQAAVDAPVLHAVDVGAAAGPVLERVVVEEVVADDVALAAGHAHEVVAQVRDVVALDEVAVAVDVDAQAVGGRAQGGAAQQHVVADDVVVRRGRRAVHVAQADAVAAVGVVDEVADDLDVVRRLEEDGGGAVGREAVDCQPEAEDADVAAIGR